MTFVFLNMLLALSSVVFAAWLGGSAERKGAIVVACMAVVAIGGQLTVRREYASVDPVGLCQDAIAFVFFSYIGINSKRIWPLWAAALQLLSVGAHFVRALKIPVDPTAYAWMKSGPTWGVLLLLIIGTLAHRRRMCLRDKGRSLPD